jgi:hypothetical protein
VRQQSIKTIREPFKLGVIGHRYLGAYSEHSYVNFCCFSILSEAKRKYPSLVAVSALAEGADSIFAFAAASLNIKLEGIIPFAEFSRDFESEVSYEMHQFLLSMTGRKTTVGFYVRSPAAYKKSMDWLVFTSHTIIAVWDGVELGSTGGTWQAISLCKRLGKTMIHINPKTRIIDVYSSSKSGYSIKKDLSTEQAVRIMA